ncbi:MAG: TolC family protein [Pseudobdellovibrionaceae bacterium]
MKPILYLSLLALVSVPAVAEIPKEMTLSEAQVKELALRQGPKALEVKLKYEQYRLNPVLTRSAYDWNINAESGFEYDKTASLLAFGTSINPKYERFRTTASLQKPFTSGTLLGIEMNSLGQKVDTSVYPSNPPPSQQTLQSAGVVLEQAILGNFFGIADRATVNAADLTYQASMVFRANELQDVVLEAVQQFWNTYVAQETYKEAINSRDRYKTLVEAVKKKTKLGYTNPGDLPQVQAEYETREQKVKSSTTDYQKNLENLLTLLALQPNTKINFNIPKEVPSVPHLAHKKVEDLRLIRSQKLRAEAAKLSLDAAESLSYPTLKVVGKAYSSGLSDTIDHSFSELESMRRPKYYVGLKFQYNFGSDSQQETITNRRVTKNLEETRLQRELMESKDLEAQVERQAQSNYEITLSTKKQKEFREKAAQELNRSYNQGRTDISILITSLNNFFDSEIQYFKALGDYAISLNRWSAARDELVTDDATGR